jgi:hypothetical protein
MNAERRTTNDRRLQPTPMFSRYALWGGRRREARRGAEARGLYVDRIGFGAGSLLLLIFFFHCLDAGFTLFHLSRGGRELNPIMEVLLRINPSLFVGTKLGLAGVGLCFLGVHKNFPYVKAGILFLLLLYAAVIAYHLLLLFRA